MLDPKDIAKADQFNAFSKDVLVPTLWNFYMGLRSEGFSEKEAIPLTQTYLATLLTKPAKEEK